MKARVISLFIKITLLSLASAQDWPTIISPSKDLGQYSLERNAAGFLYETTSYRIQTPQEIETAFLTNFVLSAESVALALKSLPLPFFTQGDGAKPLVQITFDEKSYAAAGGAAGTAGFYNGRTERVIIQWEQLSRTPAESKLLRQPAFDLLIHELTHLNMRGSLWKMEPWLSEGVAEYLAAAHLSKGKFDFTRIDAQIRDHLRTQTAADGQKVSALSIPILLQLNSRDWLHRSATLPPAQALQPYTSALLLTHFAFHGGEERKKEVRTYLKELGKITSRRDEKPSLFPSKKAASIEKKLKAYWTTRGLQLTFKP